MMVKAAVKCVGHSMTAVSVNIEQGHEFPRRHNEPLAFLRASAASYVRCFWRVFVQDVASRAAHLSLVVFQAATQRAAQTHYGDIRPRFAARGSLRGRKGLNGDRRSG